MKFVCERCHTKYSIADDKVRGKVLKVRCKTCTNVITVRETGASVEDAPTAIDAGHAHSAPTAHADVDAKAAFAAASPPAARPSRGLASSAPSAPRSTRGAVAGASTAATGGGGAELATAAVAPRRPTGPIPIPPPLPPVDDIEWYLAVDGVQTGPFGRSALVERVLAQPKTADVHVWNADLDGWKPPRDLPQIAQELVRRRRSLTPVPPPPPRRLFPTGTHPAGAEPAPPAASAASLAAEAKLRTGPAPGSIDAKTAARPPVPGTSASHGSRPANGAPAPHAPGVTGGNAPHAHADPHASPAAHSAKADKSPDKAGDKLGGKVAGKVAGTNGTSNGASSAGFAVDHLVGGDASAALSSAALPALLSSAVPAVAPAGGVHDSGLGLSAPVRAGSAAFVAKARSPRVLVAAGALVAVVICGIIGYAVLRHAPAGPSPAPVATKADPDKVDPQKSAGTNSAAMAEDLAKQGAENAAAAKARAEEPAAPPAPEAKAPVAARIEAPAPRPGRRAKRGGRSQPTSTVPPPVASGMTAEQREAAGRFGDSSGRELRVPGTTSSGARSTPVQADISRVISNNRQGIQTCYQRALLRDNSLTNGKITVRVTVGLSGRVQRVNLDATAPFRALEPCIRDVMSRWAFPPSSEEYQTEFPVVLAGNNQ